MITMNLLRREFALDVLTGLLAIAGVTLVVIGGSPPASHRVTVETTADGWPGPSGDIAAHRGGTLGTAATVGKTEPAALGRSEPVHLDIPAIGVSTSLVAVGLKPDGTIDVPPLRGDAPAGWYQDLATPGEVGPAIIVGHVDTAHDGPAVFYRLHELHPGDTISVRRNDGSRAIFAVRRLAEYTTKSFPTDAVYGAQDRPVLRMITCGGPFDRIHRQYQGNVIAFADLVAAAPG